MRTYFHAQLLGQAVLTLLALALLALLCQGAYGAHLLRRQLRPLAVLLLLCCLWPALTASAPAPAAQACDLAVSGVQLRRVVEVDRGGLLIPIGQVETSWSCTLAEAEAKAAALEAAMRQRAGVAAAPASAGLLDWIATVSGE